MTLWVFEFTVLECLIKDGEKELVVAFGLGGEYVTKTEVG